MSEDLKFKFLALWGHLAALQKSLIDNFLESIFFFFNVCVLKIGFAEGNFLL